MADGSPIEWTDATWNPLRGCSRVSPGCGGPGRNGGCYAEGIAARFSGPGQAYEGLAERTAKGGRWTAKVALAEHLLDQPLRWRKPRRIFVNSMSDLFHEKVPDEWIDQIFAVMVLAPHHTFQVLTKRAERMRAYFEGPKCFRAARYLGRGREIALSDPTRDIAYRINRDRPPSRWLDSPFGGCRPGLPLPNVWLGVSVEDQQRAEERIPHLLATPAAVRFLSCEPLLGPVDLRRFGMDVHHHPDNDVASPQVQAVRAAKRKIGVNSPDWVIAGGESGPRARPMHPDWARSLRDQCAAAGVPFFFKQWGEWLPSDEPAVGARGWRIVDDQGFSNIGKKKAGNLLDGIAHQAFPEAA